MDEGMSGWVGGTPRGRTDARRSPAPHRAIGRPGISYAAAAIFFWSLGVKWTRPLGLQFQMDWVGRVAALS